MTVRPLTALVLAATLVVAPLSLTGCSLVEGLIEQQTGGDLDLGGNTVPADFPSEVPLADGEVISGSAITGADGEKVWNVLMNVADPGAPDAIAAQLEAAGFVSSGVGGVAESGGTVTYANAQFVVNVLLSKTDAGWTANYTVARTAG